MAASVIKVGMDVGDVKAAGLELIKQLQGQVDATLQLAEAQIKYNKHGKEVGSVLRGITDSGEAHVVTLKKLSDGYELVNASVTKAKTNLAQLKSASEELAKSERERAQLNAKLEVAGRKGLAAQTSNDAADYQKWLERNASNRSDIRPPGAPPPPAGRGAGGGADDLAKKTDIATRAGERLFITWQGIVRLIEAQVIKRAIAEIGNALIESVSTAKQFSVAIAEIRTITQDMPLPTSRWREEILRLSSAFGQNTLDVANAAYETVSNQVAKGAQTFDFLSSAMKFGAATVSSTTDSVNLLSSALKSFDIPVEETERVAAILFKTIDLGRVRAKDMADTFGRIGAIANQAGVKLEEIAAAISVVTTRGVKFSDASTIITNVLQKLIKPTDEMKKLFDEWGVASGEAAIQTFGFEGVLARLNEESKKGTSRVGELFSQIRALRGAFQLSGQGFADYQSNLRKITGAQQEYNRAADEVLNSPGKQLDIASQRIKNLFTEEFGSKAIQFLVDLNKLLETSAGSADGLERSVKLVVKGLTAGAIALTTIKLLTIANIGATTTWGEAWLVLAAKSQTAGAAMLRAIPILAAFAAGYAAGEVLFNKENTEGQSREDIVAAIKAKQDAASDARKKYREVNGDKDADLTKDIKGMLDLRYQAILGFSTRVLKLAVDMKQRAIDNYRDITDHVKITAKTYFDSIGNKITDLKKVAAEADTLIKGSLKVTEELSRRTTRTLFDTEMKYASPGYMPVQGFSPVQGNQHIEILQRRIDELTGQARTKAKEGSKESFEESRKLYDEVQKLQERLFETQVGDKKRQFDERVKLGFEPATKFSLNPITGEMQKIYEFTVKTEEFEQKLNELSKERLSTERQFRDLQRQRAETAEAEAARERERLRSLQQAFSAIEKIEVFDKQGKVKEEYKKDPTLASRQFDEQTAKIRELAGNEAFGTQYQVFQDLQKQKLALVQQVQTAIRAEEARTSQEGIVRAKENTQRLIAQAGATVDKGKVAVQGGLDQLEKDLAVLEGRSLRMQTLFKIPGTDIELGSNLPAVQRAEPKRQEALGLLKEVREASRAFSEDQSADKLDLLRKKMEALKLATAEYVQAFTGKDPSQVADAGDSKTQMERIRGLDVGLNQAVGGVRTADQGRTELLKAVAASELLSNKLKELPDGARSFADGMQSAAPVVNETFRTFTESALNLTAQMRLLNTELERAARTLPAARGDRAGINLGPGDDVPGNRFGGPPKYFAFGGPVGTDRVPAMLGEDEYVMTGAATRAFAPLLRQMNAYPSRAGASGSSVTNVGDINVTVSGGDTSSKTIQEIGVGLRRAIARGTVKLHG